MENFLAVPDPESPNIWYQKPYVERHGAGSEAREFLNKYLQEIKSKGKNIEAQAAVGNVEPFVQHMQSLNQQLSAPPVTMSAYDAAVNFANKYNLPSYQYSDIDPKTYQQMLYHDAFQHAIPESYVGVVDKSLPNVLTAADEARATLQQTRQYHKKLNVPEQNWNKLASTISSPQSDFDLVNQEVNALTSQHNISPEIAKQAALARFPGLNRAAIQDLRTNVIDPYLNDLSVSEQLTQAERIQRGLNRFANVAGKKEALEAIKTVNKNLIMF